MQMADGFELRATISKVDDGLGLVMGWGIVCTEQGEPYYDTQGDHIPDASMIEAVTDFMKSSRIAGVQHVEDEAGETVIKGTIVHSFPLTADTAEAFGITCEKTGWMVAMHPDDKSVLAKFRSGEFTGFSIGGKRVVDEVVEA